MGPRAADRYPWRRLHDRTAEPQPDFGRQYELIQGKLDDIDQLPVMRNLEARLYRAAKEVSRERTKKANSPANPLKGMREHDGRNSTLYRIGRCARQIYAEHGNRDRVFEVAMDLDEERQPMSTEEVNGVVGNIWLSTTEGRNNIDRRGAFMEDFEIDAMIENDGRTRAGHLPAEAPRASGKVYDHQ